MRKEKAKMRHPIITIAYANLESWIHTPRTIIMLIMIVMLCFLEVKRMFATLDQMGVTLYWAEMPYKLLENGVNVFVSSILFFVMVSELPRQLPYQNLMLIRSDRRQWLTAQIAYSTWMVLAVLLLLIVCTLIFSIGGAPLQSGWSDNARIAEGSMLETGALIPAYIREHFSTITAIFYAVLPLLCFWFSMSMIILLCSLLGSQFIGLIICAFALLGHFIGSYDFPYPIKFAIVQELNPDIFGPERYRITIGVYMALNALMILGMYLRIKHTNLVFSTQNKM